MSISEIYTLLRGHFGTWQEWWPIFGDDPPFEMLLGAVLVQQTRWEAVEGAIVRLREAGLLAPSALASADVVALASLLKPVAFYTQKANGLIAICQYLCARYEGSVAKLLDQPSEPLRRELLALPRIGPETADVIMLYAGGHATFVIDDYTRRLLGRVDPPPTFDWLRARYDALQREIEAGLAHVPPAERREVYASYHALINEACVRYCLAKRPRCDGPPARRIYSLQAGRESYQQRHDGCPLRPVCAYYDREGTTPATP